jgi:hypothetical protein
MVKREENKGKFSRAPHTNTRDESVRYLHTVDMDPLGIFNAVRDMN